MFEDVKNQRQNFKRPVQKIQKDSCGHLWTPLLVRAPELVGSSFKFYMKGLGISADRAQQRVAPILIVDSHWIRGPGTCRGAHDKRVANWGSLRCRQVWQVPINLAQC